MNDQMEMIYCMVQWFRD